MRIIAGSAKLRKLKSVPFSTGVRPILARIKKSLFDILASRLADSHFLDLYAGTGSVGIEALSRGAARVTFVDLNPQCLSVIRQNLSRLRFFDRANLVRADASRNVSMAGGPFDLIFMGPPYHDAQWHAFHLVHPTLDAVAQGKLLKENGLIVAQHHAKEIVSSRPPWELFRQESYGDTRLSFFKYA